MGGGFLFRDVRWYNGPEGGAEKVFVAVLVVLILRLIFVCLYSSWIDLRCCTFHLFSVLRIWHRDIGGPSFWTGLNVCSSGSWVEGCLFDLCLESGWKNHFWFEIGSHFFTQVLLGLFGVSSDISEVEWWLNVIVWSNKSLSVAILNPVGGKEKLTVLLIFR